MPEDKPEPRADRLKAALRANLRRRKAQERGRAAPESPSTDGGEEARRAPAQAGPDGENSAPE